VVGVRWCVLMNGEEEALKQWASNLTLWVTVTHHIHIAHDTASIQRLTYVHVWGDHTATTLMCPCGVVLGSSPFVLTVPCC